MAACKYGTKRGIPLRLRNKTPPKIEGIEHLEWAELSGNESEQFDLDRLIEEEDHGFVALHVVDDNEHSFIAFYLNVGYGVVSKCF